MSNEYSGHPGDLTEKETLERLTIEEKKRIADPAIRDFPHLHIDMVADWLRGHECDAKVSVSADLMELVDVLLDCLEERVESGDDPEALDHFIYGYMYPALLRQVDIDPDEVADRDPLGVWDGVYE